ncbi:uncharacterized protein LOC129619365 [Condylostylus longicornis]|uniref:uncharacterized protein LOC129619365 n=1 Tax=Condylostylus longicornis TaxID=2530218 RepID=UPI00244DF011|nr:uncharacterized protein LOC129619365 [Condylostylus longicornis]
MSCGKCNKKIIDRLHKTFECKKCKILYHLTCVSSASQNSQICDKCNSTPKSSSNSTLRNLLPGFVKASDSIQQSGSSSLAENNKLDIIIEAVKNMERIHETYVEKILQLEHENNSLKKKINVLENKVEYFEQSMLSSSIDIVNLPELENPNSIETAAGVLSSSLNVTINCDDIKKCSSWKIKRRGENNSNSAPTSIMRVDFNTHDVQQQVLKKKNELKKSISYQELNVSENFNKYSPNCSGDVSVVYDKNYIKSIYIHGRSVINVRPDMDPEKILCIFQELIIKKVSKFSKIT